MITEVPFYYKETLAIYFYFRLEKPRRSLDDELRRNAINFTGLSHISGIPNIFKYVTIFGHAYHKRNPCIEAINKFIR